MSEKQAGKVKTLSRWQYVLVWVLRIVVGGVFVSSGIAKAIDLWGTLYKFSEYFSVWGWVLPHSLYFMMAFLLAVAEFLLGTMLLLGCYKRTSVWLLTAIMAFMLPLSAWIYFSSPVADCGCFGDMWVISNGATFLKNIFIMAALVWLVFTNASVPGLFRPYIQWVVVLVCFVYVLTIGLFGYMVQPLIDFRSFPVGSSLLSGDSAADVAFEFIYEKDGVQKAFNENDLPDSTWTFVDRRIISGAVDEDKADFAIFEQGEDVTEDVIEAEGEQLLVVFPEFERADVAYTYLVNELQRAVESHGGTLIEVGAIPEESLDQWRDLSMVTYPIYIADATVLKSLSRGVMSAVYLNNGVVVWKRSLASIDSELFNTNRADPHVVLDKLDFNGPRLFWKVTCIVISILFFMWILDRGLPWLVRRFKRHKVDKADTGSEKNN